MQISGAEFNEGLLLLFLQYVRRKFSSHVHQLLLERFSLTEPSG